MNERIKELAEQAGMTNDKFGMYFAKDFDSHCADGVDLEKFAELIVRECSNFLKDTLDDHFAAEQLEEHFGVTE